MLHVLDGDATRDAFVRAALPGEHVVWAEAAMEGPWPRALRGMERAVERIRAAESTDEEIVLWFDEELFCRWNAACVASLAPEGRFTNALGIHTGRPIPELFAQRRPLEPGLAELWRMHVSPDPRGLVPQRHEHLWLALHLARFPGADGLNALERAVLKALAQQGPLTEPSLFGSLHRHGFDPRASGLTDVALRQTLSGLGTLVTRSGSFALGAQAAEVLSGEMDRFEVSPPDTWVGGVHVTASNPWRWDGERLER